MNFRVIARLVEQKFVEPALFRFRGKFASEEAYYRTVMQFRKIVRGFFGLRLTADEASSVKRGEHYTRFMREDTVVLEVGCGVLGLGSHFIRALNRDCYIGCDISNDALIDAKNYVTADSDLSLKSPQLFLNERASDIPKNVGDINCDFVVFNSVFTHMSLSLIEEYLIEIKKIGNSPPSILCDISSPLEDVSGVDSSIAIRDIDYLHSQKQILDVVQSHGWKVDEIIEDFRNEKYISHLLKLDFEII